METSNSNSPLASKLKTAQKKKKIRVSPSDSPRIKLKTSTFKKAAPLQR